MAVLGLPDGFAYALPDYLNDPYPSPTPSAHVIRGEITGDDPQGVQVATPNGPFAAVSLNPVSEADDEEVAIKAAIRRWHQALEAQGIAPATERERLVAALRSLTGTSEGED